MGVNSPRLITGRFQKGKKKNHARKKLRCDFHILKGAGWCLALAWGEGGRGDLVAQIGTRLSARLIIPHEKSKASSPVLASRRIICGDLIADYI